MKNLKIFTVTHKLNPVLQNELYVTMQGGVEQSICDFYLRDNYGDNIADKNIYYSELSSTYWLWKNLKNDDYIGLAHYRRFLNIYPKWYSLKKQIESYTVNDFLKTRLFKTDPLQQQKKITTLLDRGYIIVPKKTKLDNNVYTHYQESHYIEHLDLTIEIVNRLFPAYNESFQKIIKTNKIYICNMFISSKIFWDNYHEWLFKILFELEKNIVIPKDKYQRRVFSFLSERLFNVYLEKNQVKTKEFSTIFIEY